MAGFVDQVDYAIKINGEPAEPSSGGSGTHTLVQNFLYATPFLKTTLNDTANSLSKGQQLAEGTKLSVQFRPSHKTAAPFYDFLLMLPEGNQTARQTEGGSTQTWWAFLDVPQYWTSVDVHAVKGTSSKAMQYIAGKVGLKAKVDNTSDAMTWLNATGTYHQFAKSIAAHAWVDNHSAMCFGVTPDKTLHFYDLTRRMQQPPKITLLLGLDKGAGGFLAGAMKALGFGDSDSGGGTEFRVFWSRFHSDGATANSFFNYGWDFVAPTTEGGTAPRHQNVEVKKQGPNIAMNSEVKGRVGTAMMTHTALDCGNTHKNYEKARYQNARLLALFSETLDVGVQGYTDVNLFDVVDVRVAATQTSTELLYHSGKYLVIGKAQHLNNSRSYTERLVLARTATSRRGTTHLL